MRKWVFDHIKQSAYLKSRIILDNSADTSSGFKAACLVAEAHPTALFYSYRLHIKMIGKYNRKPKPTCKQFTY